MLPGPVFNVELLTTARRARYYAARVLYGLVLMLVIWETYEGNVRYQVRNGGTVSISQMSRFANSLFTSFAFAQSGAILLLTPTLLAGVIADEKQRKTLHYLLVSRLSSGEIVLGKLAARALHIVIYLLIGLPIIALLGLLGGIDPEIVALLDIASLTTAFFLGALSILVSTYANRVRDAIIATYLIAAAWLTVPPIIESLLRYDPNFKRFQGWFLPVTEWLVMPNPVYLLLQMERPGRRTFSIWEPLAWFCGSQIVLGIVMVALAIWRLRPVYAKSGGERSAKSWSMRLRNRRARRRRVVGADPMLWKERFVGRRGGLLKIVIRIIGALALLGIGYGTVEIGIPAYRELFEYGYGGGGGVNWFSRIYQFAEYLKVMTTMIFVAWGIGVATTAAAAITAEKEEDTWTSLTTSDLTGVEILGAKMVGAAWSLRPLFYAILLLWIVGLPTGAIHPFGFLAALGSLMVFTWYAAALGAFISMRSRTTTRAMALTVVALAITNVGYLLCCIPFQPNTPLVASGCTPFAFYAAQFTTSEVWQILQFEGNGWNSNPNREGETYAAVVICVLLYGMGAAILTWRSFAGFDRLLDRPRRLDRVARPPKVSQSTDV